MNSSKFYPLLVCFVLFISYLFLTGCDDSIELSPEEDFRAEEIISEQYVSKDLMKREGMALAVAWSEALKSLQYDEGLEIFVQKLLDGEKYFPAMQAAQDFIFHRELCEAAAAGDYHLQYVVSNSCANPENIEGTSILVQTFRGKIISAWKNDALWGIYYKFPVLSEATWAFENEIRRILSLLGELEKIYQI